jgi:hypothetical protein
MKWGWHFNGRNGNGEHKNGNGCRTDSPQPDFLCIGLHKGGTTWLYQQLAAHPDFWMPPVKELHYFDQLGRVKRSSSPRLRDERDLQFLENMKSLAAKPYIDLEHYAQLFEPKGALLSGDISPNYSTLSDGVIRGIVRHFPNLKVIFLARDPVERLWSHLSMEIHHRQIETFDVTDVGEINRNLRRRGMLLRSYPSAIAERWKRHVHPDRFRIYFFDDLQRNPTELRRSILEFLGADPDKATNGETAKHNSWSKMHKLVLTDKVRLHLAQFFKKELKTCATKFGGPARNWPARYGFSLLILLAQFWDHLDGLLGTEWIA